MKISKSSYEYRKKVEILEYAKVYVRKEGWSSDILDKIVYSKFNSADLAYYFPKGYKNLIEFSLQQVNSSLEKLIQKKNIISFPLSKRIEKILYLRIKILNDDKIFYKKTFNHLLLPHNSKLMKKNLYNSVDQMWYLAGDNSTDFSFYTKRMTLASIYVNALFILYNKGLDESVLNIEKNLMKISKIPKIKSRFSFLRENLPFFLKGLFN